jgi:hypothetical protein
VFLKDINQQVRFDNERRGTNKPFLSRNTPLLLKRFNMTKSAARHFEPSQELRVRETEVLVVGGGPSMWRF